MSVWTLACFLAWLADESLCLVLPVVNRKSLFGFCYSLESLQSCCRLGLETTLFLVFLSRTAAESCRRTRSDRKDNACLPHSSHTVNLYVLGRTMACASLFDCSGPAARGALPTAEREFRRRYNSARQENETRVETRRFSLLFLSSVLADRMPS